MFAYIKKQKMALGLMPNDALGYHLSSFHKEI